MFFNYKIRIAFPYLYNFSEF
ncbi:hypothetical protein SASC598P14_001080, partial [Snodgrassella alvi SCGC AB-598-P14]